MKKNKKEIEMDFEPKAKVVDGVLILSLPDADSPVVWRMELGKTKASAIEVRAENDNGETVHALIVKTPQSDVYKIGTYTDKTNATRALLALTEAMNNAQGQLRPALPAVISNGQGRHVSQKRGVLGWIFQTLKWVFALVCLLSFLYLASIIGPVVVKGISQNLQLGMPTSEIKTTAQSTQEVPAASTPAPKIKSGAPVSADDFLNSR